jgi:hypothetical protein
MKNPSAGTQTSKGMTLETGKNYDAGEAEECEKHEAGAEIK